MTPYPIPQVIPQTDDVTQTIVYIALAVSVVILAISALMLLLRVTIGPTILDRSIALDVMVSIGISGLALEMAWNRHINTLPALLVLTLVGFLGSVAVARFVRGNDDVEAARGPEAGAGRSGPGNGEEGWL